MSGWRDRNRPTRAFGRHSGRWIRAGASPRSCERGIPVRAADQVMRMLGRKSFSPKICEASLASQSAMEGGPRQNQHTIGPERPFRDDRASYVRKLSRRKLRADGAGVTTAVFRPRRPRAVGRGVQGSCGVPFPAVRHRQVPLPGQSMPITIRARAPGRRARDLYRRECVQEPRRSRQIDRAPPAMLASRASGDGRRRARWR